MIYSTQSQTIVNMCTMHSIKYIHSMHYTTFNLFIRYRSQLWLYQICFMFIYATITTIKVPFIKGVRVDTMRRFPIQGGYYEPQYNNKFGCMYSLHSTSYQKQKQKQQQKQKHELMIAMCLTATMCVHLSCEIWVWITCEFPWQ